MQVISLPYQADSAAFFAPLAHLDYAIWLDSGYPHTGHSLDIMAAAPTAICITQHGDQHSPFAWLSEQLQYKTPDAVSPGPGIYGYFGYDCKDYCEQLRSHAHYDVDLPIAALGRYDWVIVVDHQQQRTELRALDNVDCDAVKKLLQQSVTTNKFSLTNAFQANISRAQYEQAFQQIKQHIYDGDCYQINLCQRFSAPYQGDLYQAYCQLRTASPAPFSVYFKLPNGAVLSCSPERFIKVKHQQVLTQPIKGTVKRYADQRQDEASRTALINSEKDHAENLMIVDLMRNDLSRVAKANSVRVSKLCELQTFSNVHHLVSSIHAKLQDNKTSADLLKATFPAGSITGCPKISAMNIIATLEPYQRAVYCGSMGYWDFAGNMDCNVAIRTVAANATTCFVYGGGAIVADSTVDNEYDESLLKINNLMKALPYDDA